MNSNRAREKAWKKDHKLVIQVTQLPRYNSSSLRFSLLLLSYLLKRQLTQW